MDDQFTIYIEKMHKTHDNLMSELGTIRAGRANPHVLDRIMVDYYGTPTPIQQVGNISVPVSYTHLDVYKRQPLRQFSSMRYEMRFYR